MILAGEPLALLDLHHLPGPWMERIKYPHLERRTPGIVALVRTGSARAGSRVPSATKPVVTTVQSSIIVSRACSKHSPSHAAMAVTAACSNRSAAFNS